MKRALRLASVLLFALVTTATARAATELKILFDVDRQASTGCLVNGMPGVDRVITTTVADPPALTVTGVAYQDCLNGALGTAQRIDNGGWPSAGNTTTGVMVTETRVPRTVLGTILHPMRLGFVLTNGTTTAAVISDDEGNPIIYPQIITRRRSVAQLSRSISLDGRTTDWGNELPLASGNAANGPAALRFLQIFASQGTDSVFFRFDTQSHASAPTAQNDTYVTALATPLTVAAPGVLGNDTDPASKPLSATLVAPPSRGAVVLNPDGSFSYVPDGSVPGHETFSYQASNGAQPSNVARVDIRVGQGTNHEPVAADDSYNVGSRATINIPAPGVLTNDNDADGDQLHAVLHTVPLHGTLTLNADGSFTYTNDGSNATSDSFTYVANDGIDDSRAATVHLNIAPNVPAHANGDAFTVAEGGTLNVPAPGVMSNDTDPDTPKVQLLASVVTPPTHGTLALATNGSFIYVHDGSETTSDGFTYRVYDGQSFSNAAAVQITVTPVNDPPVAVADSFTTLEDNVLTVTAAAGVLANDTDPDTPHGSLTAAVVTSVAHGTLVLSANGAFTYTPAANYNGTDSFTYTVSDGSLVSGAATVTLTVTAVNDVPTFTAGPNAVSLEDAAYSALWATAVSAGPADEAGQSLNFIVSNNNNALFATQPAISPAGVLTYVPAPNANGTATVTVSLHDNGGTANGGQDTTASATFTITVTAVNDVPAFTKGADVTVLEDSGAFTGAAWATGITAGPADEVGQLLTFNAANNNNALFAVQPAVASNGTLTFTPAANANGTATVTVTLQDNGGTANGGIDTTAAQTFVINVTAINDAPLFTKGADVTVLEDSGPQSVNPWATAISSGPNEPSQTVHFNITNNSNPALFAAAPAVSPAGVLTFTPALNANGSATITLNIQDDGGTANGGIDTSAAQTFVINVTPVNDAPSFTRGADVTVLEDAGAQSVNPWATAISPGPADEAAQSVTFVASNDNNALFAVQPAVSAAGILTFTPAANASGSATVTLTLQDNGGTLNGGGDTSAAQTFTITITPVNDVPSFTKGPDVTVDEDSGPQSFNPWATAISAGPNEATQTVHFNVTNNTNPSLFAVAPVIAADGSLTFTPAPNANGSATITLNIQDDGGTASGGVDTSATQTFIINVAAVNDPPTFNVAGNVTVLEDSGAYSGAGQLTAITPGPGDESAQNVTFGVTNDNNALFAVQPSIGSTGTLTFTPAANAFGTATVTVVATDDGTPNASSASQTFTITITPVNDAPSFTKGADVTVLEDSGAQTVNPWATALNAGPNEGTQTVHFNVVNNSNPSLFSVAPSISPAGVLSFTPATNANGSATITIDIQDDGGTLNGGVDTSATQAFVINVTAVNDAPSFAKGADQTVLEDSGAQTVNGWATSLSAGPSDESGQTLSFSVSNDNNALFSAQPSVDGSGNLTYTPAANAFGTATVTISISDNGGTANGGADTSASQTFLINVTGVNDVPTFTKGGDQTVLEDSGVHTVAGWATAISAGPSEGTQTVDFIVSNNNSALFSAQPAVAANGTLTYTPAPNANGTATVTIAIHDDGGTANGGVDTSASQTFAINVTAVNDAPSFTKGPDQTVLEESGAQTVNGWASALSAGPADESGQTLSFNVSNDNNALFSVQPAVDPSGNLMYTPAANAFGTATVTISISDNGGTANGGVDTSATQTFLINVTGVNDVPSFTRGADQSVLEDSGAHTVAGWATAISAGPNEGAQTVNFIVSNNNNALFSVQPAVAPNGTLTYTLAPNANGTATVTIAIHDDGGTANSGVDTSASQTFAINVTAVNDAPSFVKGLDQTVLENSGSWAPSGWATGVTAGPPDEVSQNLSFTVTNDNNGLFTVQPAVDASTGTLSYTLATNTFGVANVTITLHDDGGTANGGVDASAAQTFTITVQNVNVAPTFTKGPDVAVAEDSGAQTIAGWATAIDPGPGEGAQTVSFILTNDQNSFFTVQPAVSPTGTLTFTPAPNAFGVVNLTIYARDNGGTANGGSDTSPTQAFTITLTGVNDAPVITMPPAQVTLEDTALLLSTVNGNAIQVADVDSGNGAMRFFVTVTGGTATLSSTSGLGPLSAGTNGSANFGYAGTISTLSSILSNGLTFTPLPNFSGVATIQISLEDQGNTGSGGSLTDVQTLNITVAGVNDAPSFTKGSDQSVFEDSGAQSVSNWATAISPGPGEAGQTLTFNLSNDNNSLFSVQPAIDATTGTLTYTPAANANGSATVTVTLQDNGGTANGGSDTSAPQTFTITVGAVNDAPTFALAAPSVVRTDTSAVSMPNFLTALSAGPSDESSQTVTASVTNVSNPASFASQPAIDASGTLTFTPAAFTTDQTAIITVTAADNGGTANGGVDTSTQTFVIDLEAAPTVASTTPVNGATAVAPATNVVINFDQSVNATTSSFTVSCNSIAHTFTIGSSPSSTFTLTPSGGLWPAGVCTVTVIAAQISDADTNDPPDNMAADYVFSFTTNTPPTAVDDTQDALGNVTRTIADAQGVLANDTDPDAGTTLTIQNPGTPITTNRGGTITFTAGGGYTYISAAGDQNASGVNADFVDYTVKDQFGGTDTGRLTITLGPRYIYVDDTGVPGDGRDSSPFHTLAAAQAGSVAGDTILVKSGNYTDTITLKNTQQFIGQGIAANLTTTFNAKTFTVLTAGSAPTITSAAGNAITLAASNIIRGMAINPVAGKGIVGNAFTAVTVNDNTSISAIGGAALDLTTGAATIALSSTSSSTSGTNGVNLNDVTGSVALGTGAIVSPSGAGFNVSGGTATITYAGNVSSGSSTAVTIASHTTNNITLSGTITGSANGGISVSNKTSGTVFFTGAQNLSTAGSAGVTLTSNTGGAIAFSGTGLAITTSTGAAFSATGGGTVSVTGTTNTIDVTGAGSGLTLNGVTVASGNNVTFNTLNAATTTTTGVSLTSLGGSGAVQINGGTNSAVTGVSMTTMGSVGTSLSGCTINGGTAITGNSFGTITISGVTISAANQALNLTTGTVNGTFTSVSSTGTLNNDPVYLSGVGGNFTVSGGAVSDGGTGNTVFNVIGGAATIVWNGSLSQTLPAPVVSVSGSNTGSITFGGNVSASAGAGMVFNAANGSYAINGTSNAFTGGAGVNISGGSTGGFSFNSGTSITNGTVGTNNACLTVNSSNVSSLTYSGNIIKNGSVGGRLIDLTGVAGAGTITFQTGTLSASSTSGTSTGILLSNVDKTVNFSGTTTLDSGDAGIDVTGGSTGAITFGSGSSIGSTTSPSGNGFDIDN